MGISFDQFMEMSLKVGKIKEVEIHPNADKLYILKVDVGEKTVQLVGGLRENYSREGLLEKEVVVLDNLEPKTVRGVESQGMLLAADNNGKPVVIEPESEVPVGVKIR